MGFSICVIVAVIQLNLMLGHSLSLEEQSCSAILLLLFFVFSRAPHYGYRLTQGLMRNVQKLFWGVSADAKLKKLTVVAGLLTLSKHLSAQDSTNIFAPAGTPAHSIFDLSILVFAITGGIFLVVAGLFLYVLVRYRRKRQETDEDREPVQIYGSNQIELSWTVIPILVVVMLFLATARVILTTELAHKPAAALDVTVIGHQFWWEYRYPGLGVVTANELHVPVSDPKHPTPTYLTMTSADTDHSFWLPRLAGKLDVIPNKINKMWIDPQQPGLYIGQCAQYCGTQHAKMLLRVYADSPVQFAAWVQHQQQLAIRNDPKVADGQAVFEHNACISCHTINGTVATGKFGPDLTHLASRATIASGSVPNTQENIHAFVDDPSHLKPGARMPAMHLNSAQLTAVTAYLTSLK